MNSAGILALFVRSVRDDTRAKSLIWSRIGIASAVLISIMTANNRASAGGAAGLSFFATLVWMNFVAISVAGMSYFASSITEEKEEGTLGLLRMADLSPFAILLGKSTSRLVGGFLLLLVQVPFAMLSVTLGGVRMEQVIQCYSLLGAYLFFACNLGLLASVLTPRAGVAGFFALLFGLFIQLLLPFFLGECGLDPAATAFKTPGWLIKVLDRRGGELQIANGVIALLSSGVVAFLLARVSFERFCGEGIAASVPITIAGTSSTPATGRPPRAWSDAVCWKDYYYLHGGKNVAVIKFVIYLVGAIALGTIFAGQKSAARFMGGDFYWKMFCYTGFSAACFLVAGESLFATSRIFRLECKEKTVSSLVTLPQEVDDLIASKRRAVVFSLVPGLIFVGFFGVMLLIPFFEDTPASAWIWVLQGIGYVVAQIYFNHTLVAWFSLRLKWGGLPMALGISWVGNVIAAAIAGAIFNIAMLLILIFAVVAFHVNLRSAFRRRLLAAASKD